MYVSIGKTFILLIWLAVFSPITALAGPGVTAAPILTVGGGARAQALGDAFSAVSGDVTTSLWNPSGLARISESDTYSEPKTTQAAMFYAHRADIFGEAGEGLYDAFFTGARSLGNYGTIGATIQIQGQGTTLVTTDSPTPEREVSLGTPFVFTLSYADRITESLSAGINGKVIRAVLERLGGFSYAVDMGMQYQLPFDLIPTTLGAAIQNIGPAIHYIDENQSDPLPRLLRFGTSMELYRDNYNYVHFTSGITASIHKLTPDEVEVSGELERRNATNEEEQHTREQILSDWGVGIRALEWRHLQKHLGLEYWLGNILALRVGYHSAPGFPKIELSDYFTYGMGLQFKLYKFDLTFGPRLGPSSSRIAQATMMVVF